MHCYVFHINCRRQGRHGGRKLLHSAILTLFVVPLFAANVAVGCCEQPALGTHVAQAVTLEAAVAVVTSRLLQTPTLLTKLYRG